MFFSNLVFKTISRYLTETWYNYISIVPIENDKSPNFRIDGLVLRLGRCSGRCWDFAEFCWIKHTLRKQRVAEAGQRGTNWIRMNTTRRRMSTMRSTSSGILWLWALVKSREYGDKPTYVYHHILIVERINFSPFLLINHLFVGQSSCLPLQESFP